MVVSKKSRNGRNGDGDGCCGGGGGKKQEELQLATKKPSCCGSKASAPPMSSAPSSSSSSSSASTSAGETLPHLLSAPPPGSAGVALPSLWSSSTFTTDTIAAAAAAAASNPLPTALALSRDSGSAAGAGTANPAAYHRTPTTTTTTTSSAPLPSLRTLWPALLDLDEAGVSVSSSSLDGVAGGGTTTAEGEQPTTTATVPLLFEALRDQSINDGFVVDAKNDGDPSLPYAPHHLGLPEGLFDPALEPAILRASSPTPSPSTRTTANRAGQQDRLVLTACSACFLEEPLDDACGRGGGESGDHDGEEEEEEDLGCQCTSRCGCRGGGGDGDGGVEASLTARREERRDLEEAAPQVENQAQAEHPKANGVVRGLV